jgi:DNA polymerase III epsilon subunit-like protein
MTQIDNQTFLKLAEESGQLACWDIETSGLGADYQDILLCTIKPYNGKCITLIADRFNKDKKLVREAKEALEKYTVLVAHNGKRFDLPFLNTRLLYWGHPPLEKRHHVDTYLQLKYKLRIGSKSQASLISFLELPEQKLHLSPSTWRNALDDKKAMERLIERNISDCIGLQQLYDKTKHLIRGVECV